MGFSVVARRKFVEHIEEIKDVFNLHDIWRTKSPQTKSFTWSQKSPFIFWRLDYSFISNSLQASIKDVDNIATIRTDHSAILLHLQEFEEGKRSTGFWKMNISLLTDEIFVHKMNEKLEEWKKEGREFSDIRVAFFFLFKFIYFNTSNDNTYIYMEEK